MLGLGFDLGILPSPKSLPFKFKLGNKGGVTAEKKQILTEPQPHRGTNVCLFAPGRTSQHRGWTGWTPKARWDRVRAGDTASGTPQLTREIIGFDIHHNGEWENACFVQFGQVV